MKIKNEFLYVLSLFAEIHESDETTNCTFVKNKK